MWTDREVSGKLLFRDLQNEGRCRAAGSAGDAVLDPSAMLTIAVASDLTIRCGQSPRPLDSLMEVAAHDGFTGAHPEQ